MLIPPVRRATATAALILASCEACSPVGPTTVDTVPTSSSTPTATPPGSGGPTPTTSYADVKIDCTHKGSGTDYPVGPKQKYAKIGDVPFESLKAGDTVRIHHREEPYREKMFIGGRGTEKAPIRICGVAGPKGELPVIDGKDATTRKQLDFPFEGHQVRGLVIIGHPHGEPWAYMPSHIVFEGLEVRNSSPPYSYTDRAGKKASYVRNAAGIFVERASHLTIRGCVVRQNNNGIFMGTGGGEGLTQNVLLEGNHIYDNGSVEAYYEHNVYNEASNVVYQYNRFGSPRAGAQGVLGANIKERSAGVVIRYNWIEDGAHILDIVDAQEAMDTTRSMPSFHATHVYGNVIVRGTTPSGSMIHYGGDSGVFTNYRKGKLHFYNNTVIVRNEKYPDYTRTPVFELSTNEEQLDSRNNVYWSTIAPDDTHAIGMLGARDEVSSGVASFAGDWVRSGWTGHDITLGKKIDIKATIRGLDKVPRGDSPGFRDVAAEDYALASPLGAPVSLRPDISAELLPVAQYVKHRLGKPRKAEPPSLGAFGE